VITEREKQLVRQLQEEFPVCERPFEKIAENLGITEEEVLRAAVKLQEEKKLRRVSASVNHVSVGYGFNSLVAWDIPEEDVAEAAERVIQLSNVSHCYERQRDPAFDYNFYTMVHAGSEEEFEDILEQMKSMVGPVRYCSLKTVRELKKTGMKYFI
jgi:DNA-binding Lrp family transcriptional regulator